MRPIGRKFNNLASGDRRPVVKPNQMTILYKKMKETCPHHLKAYSICVLARHQDGTLEKGCCDKEFQLVKECFRNARKAEIN